MIAQQARPGNITEASLNNSISQFKHFVNDLLLKIMCFAITSVYAKKNAITKLLKDAIDDELKKIGVYYWDKKRAVALLSGKKVPMPNTLNTLSDGSMHSIREKASPVKPRFENVTESQQFKRWFGNSKIVNADGTPKILYHQTGEEFTVFDPRHKGAGTNDDETPFGIFMKPVDNDIGLKGKKHIGTFDKTKPDIRYSISRRASESDGEIEAFDVGRRANLTAEERKNTRPDVDQEDVVFAESSDKSFSYIGDTKDDRRCYVSGFDSNLSMDEKSNYSKKE